MATAGGNIVTCSTCGKKMRVKDELRGKKVKCPGCGGVIDTGAAVQARAVQMQAAQQDYKAKKADTPKSGFMPGAPDTIRSLVLGVVCGIGWGMGFGIVAVIMITLADFGTGGSVNKTINDIGGGDIVVFAGVMILFNVIYYSIFGAAVGATLGATQNAWAGFGMAALFVVASYFTGGAGICSAIFFTASLIGVLNKNLN